MNVSIMDAPANITCPHHKGPDQSDLSKLCGVWFFSRLYSHHDGIGVSSMNLDTIESETLSASNNMQLCLKHSVLYALQLKT